MALYTAALHKAGCGEVATYAHIWWQCPLFCPYWSSVLYWIEVIQGSSVVDDPWVVLFNCMCESVCRTKSLLPHTTFIAAKSHIPRY